MRSKILRTLSGLILIVLVAAQPVLARQGSGTQSEAVRVTLEGTIIESTGSGTKGVQNFRVKVVRAMDEKGNELPALKGVLLYLVNGDKAQDLIKRHGDGARLHIEGHLKVEDKDLEVLSFKKAVQSSGSK